MVVKIDLQKAYNKTDWNFLDYILARKGVVPNGDLGSFGASPWLTSPIFLMVPLKVSSQQLRVKERQPPLSLSFFIGCGLS